MFSIDLDNLTAYAPVKRYRVRAVMAIFQKDPQVLISHPRRDINSLADMRGKPVLISTTEVGPLNQVVHIWQYESQGDRETRRNTMVKDAGWPEFLKRSAELDAVHTQENRILKSTSFSPL